jgi:hypothetical protein
VSDISLCLIRALLSSALLESKNGRENCEHILLVRVWNVMAHSQKPDFVFRRNGRVHLNRQGRQFSRLLAAEVCASAVVIVDEPCSEVVWRVLATYSIRQFPLHFSSRASPCVITFQLDSNMNERNGITWFRLGIWKVIHKRRCAGQGRCCLYTEDSGVYVLVECDETQRWRESFLNNGWRNRAEENKRLYEDCRI